MNNAFKTISTLTTIKLTCPCRNLVIVQEITEKKAKNKAVFPNTPTVGFPFPIYSQKLSCRASKQPCPVSRATLKRSAHVTAVSQWQLRFIAANWELELGSFPSKKTQIQLPCSPRILKKCRFYVCTQQK